MNDCYLSQFHTWFVESSSFTEIFQCLFREIFGEGFLLTAVRSRYVHSGESHAFLQLTKLYDINIRNCIHDFFFFSFLLSHQTKLFIWTFLEPKFGFPDFFNFTLFFTAKTNQKAETEEKHFGFSVIYIFKLLLQSNSFVLGFNKGLFFWKFF